MRATAMAAACRRASIGPEIRQAADQPPGLGRLVVAPALAVADGALGQGIAVDHADLDVAHDLTARGHRAALVAVAGNLHLLVAREVDVGQRALLAYLRIDQVPRPLEIAP